MGASWNDVLAISSTSPSAATSAITYPTVASAMRAMNRAPNAGASKWMVAKPVAFMSISGVYTSFRSRKNGSGWSMKKMLMSDAAHSNQPSKITGRRRKRCLAGTQSIATASSGLSAHGSASSERADSDWVPSMFKYAVKNGYTVLGRAP